MPRQVDQSCSQSEQPDRETIHLGSARTLVVRPTTAADADAIETLYAALDADDLNKRFFTPWLPNGAWYRSWAAVGERGGFGVLALVCDADGVELAVAEAAYAMRRDGDGDLAIAVHPDWRGWLGPYLVDRLVRHASSAGIANLQADVLIENTAMRRLLEHRGAVAFDHDHGTMHVSIATTGSVPSWPPGERRPRVLVETAGGRWSGEAAADSADVTVAACRGPRGRGRNDCPLLSGEDCPLANGADAIVVLLDHDDDATQSLITAHVANNPDTPVFVRASAAQLDRCRSLTGDHEADVATILRAASDAGRRRSHSSPQRDV